MMGGLTLETLRLGARNLYLHKLRSFLTTLGIICGVGAVICMLSITEGASEAQMALIRLLGTYNVIVRSQQPEAGSDVSEARSYLLTYGLDRKDLSIIRETIPHIKRIVPMREVANEVQVGAKTFPATVVGTEPELFETINIDVAQGRALETIDQENKAKVCVIGADVRDRLFAYEDPIGKTVAVSSYDAGLIPFSVVGVLTRTETAGTPAKGVTKRNLNTDVFIPMSAADARYGDVRIRVTSGSEELTRCDFSDFIIQVDHLDHVPAVSEMVARAIECNHTKQDYVITVPLELLTQAENEKKRRRITLGAIAGISLLVGGIGIMNIMLATVTERTREIGIRRALGAKRRHITMQFLVEALLLSSAGGIIGVGTGAVAAYLITQFVGWPTVIQEWTVGASLGLALIVGLFFGIYPAAAAARLDPIEALRQT